MGHPGFPFMDWGLTSILQPILPILLDINSLEWRATPHSLSAVYADLRAGYPDVPAQMTIPSPA